MHCPPPGDLPNPGIEPRSPTLQVDFLPSEPPGKPKNIGVGSLSLLQGNFSTQKSNQGLLHCRQILDQLSYPGSHIYIYVYVYTHTHIHFIQLSIDRYVGCLHILIIVNNAAAVAKSLQSCLTLCNPIDGSPPGSSNPVTLQARTLEWVTIFFSKIMLHVHSNIYF